MAEMDGVGYHYALATHAILNTCPTRSSQMPSANNFRCCTPSGKSIEPMLYVRYHVPDEAWQYFVAEGEPAGGDYLFLGFLMASEEKADWNWVELPLEELITMPGARWTMSSCRRLFRTRCPIRIAATARREEDPERDAPL